MLKYHRAFSLLKEVQYDIVTAKTKRDKGVEYINVAAGFDTETTSIKVDGKKGAFAYIWMCGIGHNSPIYYGRTMAEFHEFCDFLVSHFGLSAEKRRLPLYVHNLGYDFEFIRKEFDWCMEGSFFMDRGEPVKALTTTGLEFRDSLKLSGLSLELTAKNLVTYKVAKRVGDLDYTLPRTEVTPLTEAELGYCKGDIEVVTAYIQEQIDYYGDVLKLPMTNTGRVRDLMRYNCFFQGKENKETGKRRRGGGGAQRFTTMMKQLTLTPETYMFARMAFAGGFTHANKNKFGQVHTNVHSIDFTSSYPAVMVSEKFPMTSFTEYEFESSEDFEAKLESHAILMLVKFNGISAKVNQDSLISESKCSGRTHVAVGCELVDAVVNNGRVDSAASLAMYMTEVDFKMIRKVYNYDDFEIIKAFIAGKGYLPKPIVSTIFELYQAKTELKGVAGQEREYQLSKGMLNSVYGMSVTDFIKDEHKYDSENDSWVMEACDKVEAITAYNTSKSRFLYYPWGVWVTAYARANLWSGILEMGDDYIYSDTDSLKFTNIENHKDYINNFNIQITAKIMRMAKELNLGLTDDELVPKTIKGVPKPLGVWDYEGCYKRFKTLGAKKYLVEEEDNSLHLTVAGLSPSRGVKYMLEACGNDNTAVFEMFRDGMHVPADKTGKLTHTYLDNDEWAVKVVDYQGIANYVKITTGVHLENTSFTVNISNEYTNLINSLMDGHVLEEKVI